MSIHADGGWIKNVRLAGCVMAAACTAGFVPGALGQAVVADYRFEGDLTSAAPGAPTIELIGSPAFLDETLDGVTRTVLHFERGEGVHLSGAEEWMGDGDFTVVVLFRFDEVSRWRRIIDWKARSSDSGLYGYYGNLNFYPVITGSGGSIQAGSSIQVVLTRDASAQVRGYVNGSPEIEFEDADGLALLNPESSLIFFQDDLSVSGEESSGAVARIRIIDGALSAAEVASLDRLPGISGLARPVITSPSTANTVAGAEFTYQIVAVNPVTAYSATGLPDWLQLNPDTGLLSGVPLTVGPVTVQLSAINAAGSGNLSLTIDVGEVALDIAMYAGIRVTGQIGEVYRVEFTESLADPIQWNLLTHVTLATNPQMVIDSDSPVAPKRYYRAVASN